MWLLRYVFLSVRVFCIDDQNCGVWLMYQTRGDCNGVTEALINSVGKSCCRAMEPHLCTWQHFPRVRIGFRDSSSERMSGFLQGINPHGMELHAQM